MTGSEFPTDVETCPERVISSEGGERGRLGKTPYRRKHYVVLAIIVLIGGATRWYGLGGKSLWSDELFTSWVVEQPASEWKSVLPRDIPPGHLVAIRLLSSAPRSDFDLRIPSAISGMLSFLLLYLLVRSLRTPAHGIVAAALLVFSTAHLKHSQEARMYAHLFAFVCASTLCLVRACRSRRSSRLWWTAYGALIVAGLFDAYTMALVIPSQGVLVGGCAWRARRNGRSRSDWWKPVAYWLIAVSVAVVALSFWAEPFYDLIKGQTGSENPARSSSLGWMPFETVMSYLAFSRRTWPLEWAIVLVGLVSIFRRDRRLGCFAVSWFILPFILLFSLRTQRELSARYLISLLPLFIWMFIEGAETLWFSLSRLCRRRERSGADQTRLRFGIASVVVFGLMSVVGANALFSLGRYYTGEIMNWRGAVNYVAERAETDDVVIPGMHYADVGVRRYWPEGKKNELRILPKLFDPAKLRRTILGHPGGVWYVGGDWEEIPEFVREGILRKNLRETKVFPALTKYGEIHVLYRPPLKSAAP